MYKIIFVKRLRTPPCKCIPPKAMLVACTVSMENSQLKRIRSGLTKVIVEVLPIRVIASWTVLAAKTCGVTQLLISYRSHDVLKTVSDETKDLDTQ